MRIDPVPIQASVIAAFYNRCDYLKLVLAGFSIQDIINFELIIADDGSNAQTVAAIESFAKDYPFPIVHLWQEDKGFRKNRMLNRAILSARSELLIFIDADCIPHPRFVSGHIAQTAKDTICTGRRVNLSQRLTGRINEENIKNGWLQKNAAALMYDGLLGSSTDIEKGFYTESKTLQKIFNRKKRGLLGCNFSAMKSDLLAVNGFDERYEKPTIGEDSDIQFRFELLGKNIISINHIAVQYHLYHPPQPRPQENLLLFEQVKREHKAFTPFGIEH